jgi:hypothetical protein
MNTFAHGQVDVRPNLVLHESTFPEEEHKPKGKKVMHCYPQYHDKNILDDMPSYDFVNIYPTVTYVFENKGTIVNANGDAKVAGYTPKFHLKFFLHIPVHEKIIQVVFPISFLLVLNMLNLMFVEEMKDFIDINGNIALTIVFLIPLLYDKMETDTKVSSDSWLGSFSLSDVSVVALFLSLSASLISNSLHVSSEKHEINGTCVTINSKDSFIRSDPWALLSIFLSICVIVIPFFSYFRYRSMLNRIQVLTEKARFYGPDVPDRTGKQLDRKKGPCLTKGGSEEEMEGHLGLARGLRHPTFSDEPERFFYKVPIDTTTKKPIKKFTIGVRTSEL